MAETDGPEPEDADAISRDGDPSHQLDEDDEPVAESGLGALWQLLVALLAVAALLVVVFGAAGLLARLFR